MASITVITVFHNRAHRVRPSIESLLAQDCEDVRIVAIDDGSRDDTLAELRALSAPNLIVIAQPNRGFTATMAAACAAADTDFIAVHGAGDESLPGRLRAQRDFLLAHLDVVAVGCAIENVEEGGKGYAIRPAETIRKGPMGAGFGISHGEVMFRRSAYLAAGGYRPFFRVAQATDLFRRMSRIGDFGYVDRLLYRRFLFRDGVNASAAKFAEHELYSAIGHDAFVDALASGSSADVIDRHGVLAPYYMPRSKKIAGGLARAAVVYWLQGDNRIARHLARRSLAEKLTLRGAIVAAQLLLSTIGLRDAMQRLAVKTNRGRNEYALSRFYRPPAGK